MNSARVNYTFNFTNEWIIVNSEVLEGHQELQIFGVSVDSFSRIVEIKMLMELIRATFGNYASSEFILVQMSEQTDGRNLSFHFIKKLRVQ